VSTYRSPHWAIWATVIPQASAARPKPGQTPLSRDAARSVPTSTTWRSKVGGPQCDRSGACIYTSMRSRNRALHIRRQPGGSRLRTDGHVQRRLHARRSESVVMAVQASQAGNTGSSALPLCCCQREPKIANPIWIGYATIMTKLHSGGISRRWPRQLSQRLDYFPRIISASLDADFSATASRGLRELAMLGYP